MKTSMQTINNRLDHMDGRISLLNDDHSKNEHIVYNLEKNNLTPWIRYGRDMG